MNDQQMMEKSHDKIEPEDLDEDPSSDIDLNEAAQTIAKVLLRFFSLTIETF